MTVFEKEKELYEVMLNKLYDYFIKEKNGAKVETIVDILALLRPIEVDAVKENFKKEEEVEVI